MWDIWVTRSRSVQVVVSVNDQCGIFISLIFTIQISAMPSLSSVFGKCLFVQQICVTLGRAKVTPLSSQNQTNTNDQECWEYCISLTLSLHRGSKPALLVPLATCHKHARTEELPLSPSPRRGLHTRTASSLTQSTPHEKVVTGVWQTLSPD